MNVVTLEQAQALKELGLPQDGWPQLAYVDTTVPATLRYLIGRGALYISRTFTTDGQELTQYVDHWAAPHLTDAILWLLGTAAWRATFGEACYFKAFGHSPECAIWDEIEGSYDEVVMEGDTPADLLRAMLEALA